MVLQAHQNKRKLIYADSPYGQDITEALLFLWDVYTSPRSYVHSFLFNNILEHTVHKCMLAQMNHDHKQRETDCMHRVSYCAYLWMWWMPVLMPESGTTCRTSPPYPQRYRVNPQRDVDSALLSVNLYVLETPPVLLSAESSAWNYLCNNPSLWTAF